MKHWVCVLASASGTWRERERERLINEIYSSSIPPPFKLNSVLNKRDKREISVCVCVGVHTVVYWVLHNTAHTHRMETSAGGDVWLLNDSKRSLFPTLSPFLSLSRSSSICFNDWEDGKWGAILITGPTMTFQMCTPTSYVHCTLPAIVAASLLLSHCWDCSIEGRKD